MEQFLRPFAFHPLPTLLVRQVLGHNPYIAKGKPPLLVQWPFLYPAVRDCKDVSANTNLAAALALTYELEWIRLAADHGGFLPRLDPLDADKSFADASQLVKVLFSALGRFPVDARLVAVISHDTNMILSVSS